jgi:hypothetical protein
MRGRYGVDTPEAAKELFVLEVEDRIDFVGWLFVLLFWFNLVRPHSVISLRTDRTYGTSRCDDASGSWANFSLL